MLVKENLFVEVQSVLEVTLVWANESLINVTATVTNVGNQAIKPLMNFNNSVKKFTY